MFIIHKQVFVLISEGRGKVKIENAKLKIANQE
jgi:hypothetical protein